MYVCMYVCMYVYMYKRALEHHYFFVLSRVYVCRIIVTRNFAVLFLDFFYRKFVFVHTIYVTHTYIIHVTHTYIMPSFVSEIALLRYF
jgi:hypothetical protein